VESTTHASLLCLCLRPELAALLLLLQQQQQHRHG
jgi:hypothetical protein